MSKSNGTTTARAVKRTNRARDRIHGYLVRARLQIEHARNDGIDVSSEHFHPYIGQAVAALTAQVVEFEAQMKRLDEMEAAAEAEEEALDLVAV
jgi:hypothetical protein